MSLEINIEEYFREIVDILKEYSAMSI